MQSRDGKMEPLEPTFVQGQAMISVCRLLGKFDGSSLSSFMARFPLETRSVLYCFVI